MKICLNCERYVKTEDTNCPFCSGSAFEHDRPVGSAHWSRAKVFAARSAMATAALGTAVACGKVDEPDRPNMASGGARASGGDGAVASGGVSSSAGGQETGTGGVDVDGSGGEDTNYGGEIAIYGGPFPDMVQARV
jgi:hypothetical protein